MAPEQHVNEFVVTLVIHFVQTEEFFLGGNDLARDLHSFVDVLGGVEAVNLRLISFAVGRSPVQRVVGVEREIPFAALEARAHLNPAPRAGGCYVLAVVCAHVWGGAVGMLHALAAPVITLDLGVVRRFGGRAGGVAVFFIFDRARSWRAVTGPWARAVDLAVRAWTVFACRAIRNIACFANGSARRVVALVGLRRGLARTVALIFRQCATAVVAHLAFGVLDVCQIAAIVVAVTFVEDAVTHPAKWLACGVEACALSSGGLVVVLHWLGAPAARVGRGVRAVRAVLVDMARVMDRRRCNFQWTEH